MDSLTDKINIIFLRGRVTFPTGGDSPRARKRRPGVIPGPTVIVLWSISLDERRSVNCNVVRITRLFPGKALGDFLFHFFRHVYEMKDPPGQKRRENDNSNTSSNTATYQRKNYHHDSHVRSNLRHSHDVFFQCSPYARLY